MNSGAAGTSIAQRLGSMRAGCDLWQREGQRMLDDEDAAGPSNAATRDPADDIALVLHASSTGDCVRSAIEASANYHEVCILHGKVGTRHSLRVPPTACLTLHFQR